MTNEVIYIPEYVEQGVSKLQQAKTILAQIEAAINSGISTINSSGYNRGIPHIEKGSDVSSALSSLESTIDTITSEIQKYSNGEALELENAIIIADPATIEKYGLKKEDIDYTLSDYILKSDNVASNQTIQAKWASGYLTAPAGYIKYTGADGRLTKETWCNLNPNNLAKLMREDHGIELDFWIREDGVYMYGDYVMVAADIPHMDGTQQEAEYRKGDLVQTSLGTGMVVDLCGMAESTRKGNTDVDVWYDIYTAWGAGGDYGHVAYCKDADCNESSHTNPQSTMIREAENPTTINPRTGQPISSGFVFNSNASSSDTTASTTQNRETTETVGNTTQSTDTFTNNTETQTDTTTTNTVNNTSASTALNNNTTNSTNTFTNTNTTNNNTSNTNNTYVGTTNNSNSSNYSGTSNSNTSNYSGTSNSNTSNYSGTSSSNSSNYSGTSSSNSSNYSGTSSSTSSTTSSQSSSQVSSIYNVNGFSKPVTNTTTTTPVVNTTTVTTPVVSTPTVSTPTESTPVVTTPEVNTTPSTTPDVEINNTTDTIVSTPVETPTVNDYETNTDIIENDNTVIESVPSTPADTKIEGSNNSNIPLIATLVGAGALATGIGAKVVLDKRKENQDNGEDDFSNEE